MATAKYEEDIVMPATKQILAIVTNVDEFERVGLRTGLWLAELVDFWIVATAAGCTLQIASPAGGKIPVDPESLVPTELGDALGIRGELFKHYADKQFMGLLRDTQRLENIDDTVFEAIYLTGGHGAMFDYPACAPLQELVKSFYCSNRVVAAVCHGPCGLLNVHLNGGKLLLEGKRVTGYSWKEEVAAKRDNAVSYSLEDELKERGAHYSKSALPLGSHIVEDGVLITGQNHMSTKALANAVVKRLSARPLVSAIIEPASQ
jgi:putative intracellular protease/amidase